MAAGIGTRLEPLTYCVPKPMVPVGNAPVISHILRTLKRYGVKEIISNTYYLAPQLESLFDNFSGKDFDIHYIREEELSGTAGGVKEMRRFSFPGSYLYRHELRLPHRYQP